MGDVIEIKPGMELDSAIAKIVGVPMPPWASEPYRPSTDLNAAFAAAKKAGLFDGVRDGHLFKKGSRWHCSFARHVHTDWNPYGITNVESSSPALAICAAILKLKAEP
ncbi:hypothetical protein [Petrachloros mirabilis]